MTPPSILVVDDGELARVTALLGRLSVDFDRVERPARDAALARPRDVLLSSGPRAMAMPPLAGDGDPVWVCIYDQDFLPLRERLRDLGVHYLVSGSLPSRAFELFLRQLLHRGRERRRVRRIPLRCAVEVEQGAARWSATLLELSREGCVFRMPEPDAAALDPTRPAVVRLPPAMMGEHRMDLGGSLVLRGHGAPDGPPGPVAVLVFRDLDPDASARLEAIVTGRTLGTQVTPLAPEPARRCAVRGGAVAPRRSPPPPRVERRRAPRHRYERRVEAVAWHGEEGRRVALGRDLSASGLRIVVSPPPREGSAVTLALYGGAREEPVVVRARVVRQDEVEAALRFEGLGPGERRGLDRLLRDASRLEDLGRRGGRVVVAELV